MVTAGGAAVTAGVALAAVAAGVSIRGTFTKTGLSGLARPARGADCGTGGFTFSEGATGAALTVGLAIEGAIAEGDAGAGAATELLCDAAGAVGAALGEAVGAGAAAIVAVGVSAPGAATACAIAEVETSASTAASAVVTPSERDVEAFMRLSPY